jgi:protein AroM
MFPSSAGTMLAQAGALDMLNDREIADLHPRTDEHVLVTRLRDGREVTIAKERVLDHLQDAVTRLEEEGASVICVLCTGEFTTLSSRSLVIYPDRILSHTVESVLPSGTIGILMPHPLQHESMMAKWSTGQRSVVTASVSPYSEADEIAAAISDLEARGAAMIVMDCMGFDRQMQNSAVGAVGVPVLLANGLTGSVLSELIPGIRCGHDEAELVEATDCGHGREIRQAE